MAKSFFSIVRPVVRAGIGDLVDVCEGNETPDAFGVFTFNEARRFVTNCAAVKATPEEARQIAVKVSQELIEALEIRPVASFWEVSLRNGEGDTFWFADANSKEEAIDLACSYGMPVFIQEKRQARRLAA